MDERILSRLGVITEEEEQLLSGRTSIDRSIYMNDGTIDVITGRKLLEQGKQITVRPHTRFVHFPCHTHDYVEIVYMCQGSTRHLINDTPITLHEGELLLLGQNTRQEILPAGEGDIAVNFIVRCLCGDNPSGFMHFRVADVKPVQNLVENLLWTLISDTPNRRSINQLTMGLLFVQLLNHTDKLTVGNKEQDTIVWVLRYIEEHYADGSLTEIADMLHYDVTWLSREIKRRTGKTYTELLQEKRLSQAAWLLRNTSERVADIGCSVGYENLSYFHRIFAQHFGTSPKSYRDCK